MIDTTNFPIFNRIKKYKDSDIKEKFASYKEKIKGFTETNSELDLKVGDTVQFVSGYNLDMLYTTEILGFDSDGDAYGLWDCYWVAVILPIRQYKKL